MNVMWYTGKFDEACWQLLAMIGLRASRFAQDRTGMVAAEQHIPYKRELHAGDAITIQSSILEVKDKSLQMLHTMVDDATGEVAATNVVVGVPVDARIRKAIRLPDGERQKAIELKGQEAACARDEMNSANLSLIREIFENAEFIRSLGIELTSCGMGWCETRINAALVLRQQHGFFHAGVLMTLADHTCGGAAASTVPEGRDVITVETKISFLRPASGQSLICRAEVLRAGKNLIFAEATVMAETEEGRRTVAKASSTLAVITKDRPGCLDQASVRKPAPG